MLTAQDLPKCRLSDVLENRLNKAVESERISRAKALNVDPASLKVATGLTVRVVNNVDRKSEVRANFAKEFCHDGRPDAYLYKQKVIVLFQQIDGVDMCLFCMYLQEYDQDCPAPNARTGKLEWLKTNLIKR